MLPKGVSEIVHGRATFRVSLLIPEVARRDRHSSVLVSLLELDHVVTNRAEIGEVVDVPSKLLHNRVAQTQRQALQNAFFGAPLEIKIELVLPKLPRLIRLRAKHRQGIGAQSVDPGKVITSPKKKRALTGPVEVLNLNTGIAGIAAPRVLHGGVPPGVGESRGKQRLLDGQFYFDAELMARETVALQLVVPETTLIDVLASEPQPPVGGKRDFETRLGIGDVDNILTVVVDRTNVKFSFLINGSGCPDASLNRSARVDCHRHKFAVILRFDFVEISKSVLDRRDVWGRGRRRGRNLFSILAQARAVGGRVDVAAALAKLGAALQDNRLKGIWRHAGVVAADKRCVVALGSDTNGQVVDDPNFSVEFAQDRIAILPGR